MRTEQYAAESDGLDIAPTRTVVDLSLDHQGAAIDAVRAAADGIADAADAAAARLGDGAGRLIYAGAGTSGRLAVQDGVELTPTFRWPAERCVFLIAGGERALTHAVEGAEDDAQAGADAIAGCRAGPADVLIVLAASGATAYALGAAQAAGAAGALVVGVANNPGAPLLDAAHHPILLDTGAELIAGSTRMKAGTAQRALLTTLSSAIMVRLGRVHDGYMVDLQATNEKLRRRSLRVVRAISRCDEASARDALGQADGHVKLAILIARGAEPPEAKGALDAAAGHLRAAMASLNLG